MNKTNYNVDNIDKALDLASYKAVITRIIQKIFNRKNSLSCLLIWEIIERQFGNNSSNSIT